jgi:hypothetical protein
MRSSITLFFVLFNILLCLIWSAAKKIKDEDFSEFDDFDRDEFVVGMYIEFVFKSNLTMIISEAPSPSGANPSPSKTQSNKPKPTNNDGPPHLSLSKTTAIKDEQKVNEDDVTADDDDDDDDLMFDEEEFETVFFFS